MNMDMLFLPVYGKNKMPDRIGCFIVFARHGRALMGESPEYA